MNLLVNTKYRSDSAAIAMTEMSGVGETRESIAQVIDMWRWHLSHYNRENQVKLDAESVANVLEFCEKLTYKIKKYHLLVYCSVIMDNQCSWA